MASGFGYISSGESGSEEVLKVLAPWNLVLKDRAKRGAGCHLGQYGVLQVFRQETTIQGGNTTSSSGNNDCGGGGHRTAPESKERREPSSAAARAKKSAAAGQWLQHQYQHHGPSFPPSSMGRVDQQSDQQQSCFSPRNRRGLCRRALSLRQGAAGSYYCYCQQQLPCQTRRLQDTHHQKLESRKSNTTTSPFLQPYRGY